MINEPEDQQEVSCSTCGEQEKISHQDGCDWYCGVCDEGSSDGSDRDDSDYE